MLSKTNQIQKDKYHYFLSSTKSRLKKKMTWNWEGNRKSRSREGRQGKKIKGRAVRKASTMVIAGMRLST